MSFDVTIGLSMLTWPRSTGSVSPEKDLAGKSKHKLTMQLKSRIRSASFCASLCLYTFAAGRAACVAFPVLGVQSATAPDSCSGKKRLAGDTGVDVGIKMAVGAWVACSSFGRALTFHLTVDSLLLAANKTASSITGVS